MTDPVRDDLLAPAPPSLWQRRVGGMPRPFWYLWTGTLVNRAGSFVGPFLALYLTRERGYSLGETGLVLTFLGLGSFASQPVGGALADRIGRRATMVSGMALSAVAVFGVGLARGLPALCVAVLAYGLVLDLFRPAAQAAVADLVPAADRPRAYALNFWAINIGFSIATPLGGLLADRGYALLFALDAATCLAMAALVLRGVPETRPERVPGAAAGSFSEVLRDRLMLALVCGVVLQAVVYLQAFSTLPLVIDRDGLGPSGYGLAIGVNGVLIVALQPLLLGVLGRRGRGPLLLTAALLQGLGFGLTAFADSLSGHVVAIVVWTIGEILGTGQLGALVAGLAPPHLRGRYMGLFGTSFGLAALIAPLAGTQVLERVGEDALWGGCAGLCAASGVVLLRVSAAAGRRNA